MKTQKINELTRAEKINLINKLAAGDIPLIINGFIIGDGVVLIEKDGEFYLDGSKININEFNENVTAIILPDNGRGIL